MFQRQLFSNPKDELRPGIFFGKEMVRKLDAPHNTGSNGAEIQGVVKEHHRPSSGNAFGGIRMSHLINRINCALCRVVEANDIWLLLWGLRTYCAIMMHCAHDYVFVSLRLVVDDGGFVLKEEGGRMQLHPSFVFEGLRKKAFVGTHSPNKRQTIVLRMSDSSLSVKKLSPQIGLCDKVEIVFSTCCPDNFYSVLVWLGRQVLNKGTPSTEWDKLLINGEKCTLALL